MLRWFPEPVRVFGIRTSCVGYAFSTGRSIAEKIRVFFDELSGGIKDVPKKHRSRGGIGKRENLKDRPVIPEGRVEERRRPRCRQISLIC
jgi:hypothetical protein